MPVYKEKIELRSHGVTPTFINITPQVKEAIARSGIRDGIVTVISPHTTCSCFFEEFVHDRLDDGTGSAVTDFCNWYRNSAEPSTFGRVIGDKRYLVKASAATTLKVKGTPAILYSSSQYQLRLSKFGMFSIAAAAVMSLKIEPGVKPAERQRLMKAPSLGSVVPSMGSTEGVDTMPKSSPVR